MFMIMILSLWLTIMVNTPTIVILNDDSGPSSLMVAMFNDGYTLSIVAKNLSMMFSTVVVSNGRQLSTMVFHRG